MIAIRVIYNGEAFVPQQSVSLPDQFEALVLVDQTDVAAQAQLDSAVRDYYRNPPDADDEAWGKAVTPQSTSAWDED